GRHVLERRLAGDGQRREEDLDEDEEKVNAQPALPASRSRPSAYISSMRWPYFSRTTLRFTLSVGVSSPDSCVRSWGRMRNFLIRSYDESSSLVLRTISSTMR